MIIEQLRQKVPSSQIIACVRHTEKAEHYLELGIEVRFGDYDLPESLDKAFSGITQLLLISSSHTDDSVRLVQHSNVITGSPQGRELDFEMNAVVPYIIYMELKDLLTKGELKTVINTSSNSLLTLKRFEHDQLGKAAKFKKLFGSYATSKMALSMWTQEASAIAVKEGIEIRSVCPGPNKTTMTAGSGMPKWLIPVRHLLFKHPSAGAARVYEAAFGDYKGTVGIFIHKGKATPLKFSQHSPQVFAKIDTIYKHEFLTI